MTGVVNWIPMNRVVRNAPDMPQWTTKETYDQGSRRNNFWTLKMNFSTYHDFLFSFQKCKSMASSLEDIDLRLSAVRTQLAALENNGANGCAVIMKRGFVRGETWQRVSTCSCKIKPRF